MRKLTTAAKAANAVATEVATEGIVYGVRDAQAVATGTLIATEAVKLQRDIKMAPAYKQVAEATSKKAAKKAAKAASKLAEEVQPLSHLDCLALAADAGLRALPVTVAAETTISAGRHIIRSVKNRKAVKDATKK